jgi:hypothetical protein
MTELNTCNYDLGRINGVIYTGLTAIPSELGKRCEERSKRLHSLSNQSQGTEATLRELLREYGDQKTEVSDKDELLTSLKHNIIVIGEKSIEAKQTISD